MPTESRTPTYQELVNDLQDLREKGLTHLRRLRLEALHRAALLCGLTESVAPEPAATEALLAAAVEAQRGGALHSKLQMAAEYTFGLIPGTRDWPPQDRRKEAARVYGVSTERFRKAQEKTIYEQIAEEILKLCHRSQSPTEASSVTELVLTSNQIHSAVTTPAPSIGRSAIPHLFMLDDVPDANINAIVNAAREISIVGRTAINVIAGYTRRLLDMLRSGGELRLVLVDPGCDAARYLYGKNFAIYRRNFALAAVHLKSLNEDLNRDYPGRSVELRLMTDIPPFSLLIAENLNPEDSFIQVQLNFLYTRISRDRPIIRLYRDEPWFDRFYAEFKAIWNEHSEPSTPEWLLEHIDVTERTTIFRSWSRLMPNAQNEKEYPFDHSGICTTEYAGNDDFAAIYNIAPILPGHSLIIPRRHVERLSLLSEDEVCRLFTFARKITGFLLNHFNAEGFDWTIQDGTSAGQTISHVHLHVIPRWPGDLPSPGDWYLRAVMK